MSERLEKSMKEISVSVAKSQKEQEAQTREVLALREKVTVAIEQMEQMEGDMVSQEELSEMQQLIQEVTSKAGTVEAKIEKAKEDAEIMVGTIQKNSQKLEEKLSKETKAREKQDKEIAALQSKVSELMVQLEQKISEETTNEVESMVSVIQEKIRKEKTERFRSEKEITLMREEMAKMQTEIHREKNIV